jgi:hypothetical protein
MNKTLFAVLSITMIFMACAPSVSTDKTLVAWIEINDPERWVGTVFAVQNDKQYDGIMVTGEDELKWRVSSEDDVRSGNINDLSSLPTVQIGKMEQVAVVYAGDEIRLYINGQLSSSHVANNIDLLNALFISRC